MKQIRKGLKQCKNSKLIHYSLRINSGLMKKNLGNWTMEFCYLFVCKLTLQMFTYIESQVCCIVSNFFTHKTLIISSFRVCLSFFRISRINLVFFCFKKTFLCLLLCSSISKWRFHHTHMYAAFYGYNLACQQNPIFTPLKKGRKERKLCSPLFLDCSKGEKVGKSWSDVLGCYSKKP